MTCARNAGNLLRIVAGTLLCLLLAGCGLKGDLYLPEPELPAPASAASEPTPEPANEPDSDTEKKSARQPEAAPGQP